MNNFYIYIYIYILAIVNNAAVNAGEHVSFRSSVLFLFLDMYPGLELLDAKVVLFLVF